MPAFNTNMFKLASSQYLCNHIYRANQTSEHLIYYENSRLESVQKNIHKMIRKEKKKDQEKEKSSTPAFEAFDNQSDYFLLRKQVDEICSEVLSLDVNTPSATNI